MGGKLFGDNACAQKLSPPTLTGNISGVKCGMGRDFARDVSLAHVSCILMYVYVALLSLVGAWLMVLVL